MNLAAFSIRNYVFAWMLIFGFIFLGLFSMRNMKLSYLPDVDYPIVQVGIELDGASPEEIEKSTIQYLENAFTGISGLQKIYSNINFSLANITLEFDASRSMDMYVQDVQIAISSILKKLPNYLQPISIKKSNPEGEPIIWLAAENPGLSFFDFVQKMNDQVVPRLSQMYGVSEIVLSGYEDPTILVYLKLNALKKYQLTATDILTSIQQGHFQLPGGILSNAENEFPIYLKGEAEDLQTLEGINILKRGGAENYRKLQLKDVVTIQKGTRDLQTITRLNGQSAIGIGVKKQADANIVTIANGIKKWLPSSPIPLKLMTDLSVFIKDSVAELVFTIIFSIILTALLCWLFLGSWFNLLNVTLAIPTSILGTFIFLSGLGYSLNTFTLLALSLAVGIIVDDAIMVIENIFRHLEMGKTPMQAALDGATQITPAAIATTAAICVIFLPVFFMNGVIGQYFLQFGVTLSIAIIISLIEALTLTPMRCAWYQKRNHHGYMDVFFKKMALWYQNLLAFLLRYSFVCLSVSFLFFIGMILLFNHIKKEYMPRQNVSQIALKLQSLKQESLEEMNQKVLQIEQKIKKIPEIDSVLVSVGTAPDGSIRSNAAQLNLNLIKSQKRIKSSFQISEEIREHLSDLKDMNIILQDISPASLTDSDSFPIDITLVGDKFEVLQEQTKSLIDFMTVSHLFADIYSSLDVLGNEIQIIPRRDYLEKIGMPVSSVINDLHWCFAGDVAGHYSNNSTPIDIFLSMAPKERRSLDSLKKIFSFNNNDFSFPIDALVSTKMTVTTPIIYRQDKQRAVRIRANLAKRVSQESALKMLEKKMQDEHMIYNLGGNAKVFRDSFSDLFLAFFVGVILAYMILASQFNNFLRPLSVLMALPFAYSGAIFGLYLMQQSLNIYSMMGMLLLMGIAKKNSILLVEFVLQLEEKGYSTYDALLSAGLQRLRPVLITSMATIIGALPAAFSVGPGAESRVPMAVVIISGSFISTLFTLLTVPCCDYWIAKLAYLLNKKRLSTTGSLDKG